MQWLLHAFGIIGVCGTICMKLSAGLLLGGLASSPILAAVREAVRGDLSGLWYRCCAAHEIAMFWRWLIVVGFSDFGSRA